MKKEEIDAINTQIYALLLFLFSIIVSIIITYNQKLDLEGKETIMEANKSLKITLYNRILIVTISLIFLFVNYKLYLLSKEEGKDLKGYKLQILASILVTISGIIALYVVSLSNTENIADVENPII